MYNLLKQLIGCIIEVGQDTSDGRRWYAGMLNQLDETLLQMVIFDSDGQRCGDVWMNVSDIVNVHTHSSELDELANAVIGRQEKIEALKRCLKP